MINVKELSFEFGAGVRGSDFEDISLDVSPGNWTSYKHYHHETHVSGVFHNLDVSTPTSSPMCQAPMAVTPIESDSGSSLMALFSQSIEMFGAATAPWPIRRTYSATEQSGLFLTSEMPVEQSPPPSESASQLKRRISANSRKASANSANAELIAETRRIYEHLEPVPIVTASPADLARQRAAEAALREQHEKRAPSKFATFLSLLYSRGAGSKSSRQDEETTLDCESEESYYNARMANLKVKSILKKSMATGSVQKSANISSAEARGFTSNPPSRPSSPSESVRSAKTSKLRFDNEVIVCETFHREEYSRQSVDYVARQLTPSLALAIKRELNSIKQEMEVHEDSRHLTQFYAVK